MPDEDELFTIALPAMVGGAHPVWVEFVRKHAGNTILDFGCGFGAYAAVLNTLGFACVGVDPNEQYVQTARQNGVDARLVGHELPFADKSFETVILLEVLEHVRNPEQVLREAKRVARKNVLLTVPNCGEYQSLRGLGLTYAHVLAKDHLHFFTEKSLAGLLSRYFDDFIVEQKVPIYPHKLLPRPVLYFGVGILYKLGLVKPRFYQHLFATATLARGERDL